MPADTSNSSTEDEENSPTNAPTGLPEPTVTKHNGYTCPDDFVSFTHKPCSSTLSNSLKNKNSELWLIKAPASFNPERFNGVAVPLSGLQTVRMAAVASGAQAASGAGGDRKCLYSVLGTKRSPADLHLLTADGPASGRAVCGPAFAGVLNVCEVYGDGGHGLRHPQAIAAAPAPAIPPGLKQRFLPFGCRTPAPTRAAKHSLAAEEEEEEDEAERRKERKRRKREKRIKMEGQDPGEEAVTAEVKTEPDGAAQEGEGGASEESSSRRKKKKKKKDKEKEAWGEGSCVVKKEEEEEEAEAPRNCEPTDVSSENLEGSAKKKKKKRKSKVEEA